MSKKKRSETLEKDKHNATVVFHFVNTLRRLNLAQYPSGLYYNTNQAFTVWAFAKKYGVDDVKNSK